MAQHSATSEGEKAQTTLDASRFRADGGVTAATAAEADLDLSEISLEEMELEGFPDPRKVSTVVDEDEEITGTTSVPDPDEIEPENNIMLVMDGQEVAEYLHTQQKKTDHWLNNELKTLIQRGLTGQRGMTKGKSFSTYDKEWLVRRERKRRADADEWNPTPSSDCWQDLPNAEA